MRRETERLRSALLTSLSPRPETPLASIIGALTACASYRRPLRRRRPATSCSPRRRSEAERLDRFVGNLLDMTRLEAGAIVPNREPVDVAELVVARAAPRGAAAAGPRVATSIAPDLPPLSLDFVLSSRSSSTCSTMPPNTRRPAARITSRRGAAGTRRDRGATRGRASRPGARPHVRKFYRAHAATGGAPAPASASPSAKGFVEAMGGTIAARNRTDRSGRRVPSVSWPRLTSRDDEPPPILIVEDEPPIRRFLRTTLGAQGFHARGGERRRGAVGCCASTGPT